ncbi:hypothetical protein [Sphingobium sp. R-7]|uniref:hypothetical protein n=1 Tax=Sphingobium sp. R-7 TaxID=3375449 RepID=UPI00398B050B
MGFRSDGLADRHDSNSSGDSRIVLKLHRQSASGEVSTSPFPPQFSANPVAPNDGTQLAVSYLNSGVAAYSSRHPGRGGARNSAGRESYGLSAVQIASLKAAERHAAEIGLPFTRMITIHWEGAGVPLADMAKATGRFIDLMTKTLTRHGSRTAWLWVHENGDGKGGHCHLLIHVPAGLVPFINKLQRGWLRRISDEKYRKGVIHSTPVGGRLGLEVGNPDLHASNLEKASAYLLKGASTDAAIQHGLQRQDRGGYVIGKRCGTSQNIGTKARREMTAREKQDSFQCLAKQEPSRSPI